MFVCREDTASGTGRSPELALFAILLLLATSIVGCGLQPPLEREQKKKNKFREKGGKYKKK
jgi:predicted small lipoprotein YifL